jgi:hypothetical protein
MYFVVSAGEKCLGEPPVQQYLWSGKTKLNAFVPISTPEGSNSSSTLLGDTKRSQWAQVADDNMYATSAQVRHVMRLKMGNKI